MKKSLVLTIMMMTPPRLQKQTPPLLLLLLLLPDGENGTAGETYVPQAPPIPPCLHFLALGIRELRAILTACCRCCL